MYFSNNSGCTNRYHSTMSIVLNWIQLLIKKEPPHTVAVRYLRLRLVFEVNSLTKKEDVFLGQFKWINVFYLKRLLRAHFNADLMTLIALNYTHPSNSSVRLNKRSLVSEVYLLLGYSAVRMKYDYRVLFFLNVNFGFIASYAEVVAIQNKTERQYKQ